MEELDYWRLCEELNIVQAALLVIGEEPACAEYIEDQEVHNRPKGYEAAKTAIHSSLLSGSITGTFIPQEDFDINGNHAGFLENTVDFYKSTVNAESLKQWLRRKGFTGTL
jgi:hypothetical protein